MRLEAQTRLEAHQNLHLLFHLNDTLPMQQPAPALPLRQQQPRARSERPLRLHQHKRMHHLIRLTRLVILQHLPQLLRNLLVLVKMHLALNLVEEEEEAFLAFLTILLVSPLAQQLLLLSPRLVHLQLL